MRLLIVSSVIHYRYDSCLHAYGPYAREIDIWADLFPEVIIAAPCRDAAPPGDCLPFTRRNISIQPQKETGGVTLKAKALQILSLPDLIWGLMRAMRSADAIHIRCPGYLGLLGAWLAPLFSKRLVAKFAGQWSGFPGMPLSMRLERWLLRSAWWRGPVTVYGRWPNEPRHIIPFFTSIMTSDQMARARAAFEGRIASDTLQVLYTGRLDAAKNVGTLIEAIAKLKTQAVFLKCVVVGDGPHRSTLEVQATELGLRECIEFVGSVSFERVLDFYEQSDVLVLASNNEGWPKSIAEGMAFGLICIGSNRGLVPEMLGEGRGLVVPPGDADALAQVLGGIAIAPQNYRATRAKAFAWAQQYSLEGLRDALRELLSAHWGVSFKMLEPADEQPKDQYPRDALT